MRLLNVYQEKGKKSSTKRHYKSIVTQHNIRKELSQASWGRKKDNYLRTSINFKVRFHCGGGGQSYKVEFLQWELRALSILHQCLVFWRVQSICIDLLICKHSGHLCWGKKRLTATMCAAIFVVSHSTPPSPESSGKRLSCCYLSHQGYAIDSNKLKIKTFKTINLKKKTWKKTTCKGKGRLYKMQQYTQQYAMIIVFMPVLSVLMIL